MRFLPAGGGKMRLCPSIRVQRPDQPQRLNLCAARMRVGMIMNQMQDPDHAGTGSGVSAKAGSAISAAMASPQNRSCSQPL